MYIQYKPKPGGLAFLLKITYIPDGLGEVGWGGVGWDIGKIWYH